MTACGHHHNHSHHDQNTDIKRLIAAFCVTAVFMVVEFAGGVISGSLALIADAGHMSTDALALALAASAHWFSRRPADGSLHFGYRRVQVLAAFVNGILLMALIAWICFEAVQRFFQPEPVTWSTMLVVAVLGLISNAVAFSILTYGNVENVNIRGAMLHVVSDLLGSVAAVVAALVIMATGWLQVDPILSLIVAMLIGRSGIKLLRETGHILLEGAPSNIDVPVLVKELKACAPEIADIHKVQIWQLTPEHPRLTMHVAVSRSDAAAGTLARIKSYLEEKHGDIQSTIQIEMKNHCPDILIAKAANDIEVTPPSGLTASDKEGGQPVATGPDRGTTIH